MDATAILKKDHAKVKALFKEVEELSDRSTSSRQKLFQQIDEELTLHAQVEEKIFYPAFKAKATGEDKDLVLEAVEEHAVVKSLIGQLENLDPKDETYKAKLSVLIESVLHHAKEEESEMFPHAQKLLGKGELERLGDLILAAKERAGAPA